MCHTLWYWTCRRNILTATSKNQIIQLKKPTELKRVIWKLLNRRYVWILNRAWMWNAPLQMCLLKKKRASLLILRRTQTLRRLLWAEFKCSLVRDHYCISGVTIKLITPLCAKSGGTNWQHDCFTTLRCPHIVFLAWYGRTGSSAVTDPAVASDSCRTLIAPSFIQPDAVGGAFNCFLVQKFGRRECQRGRWTRRPAHGQFGLITLIWETNEANRCGSGTADVQTAKSWFKEPSGFWPHPLLFHDLHFNMGFFPHDSIIFSWIHHIEMVNNNKNTTNNSEIAGQKCP